MASQHLCRGSQSWRLQKSRRIGKLLRIADMVLSDQSTSTMPRAGEPVAAPTASE